MSRYVSWQDVTDKYNAAAQISGSSNLKENYVDAAEDEIEAALAGIYTVPFTPVPAMVRDLVVDLAWFKMIFMQEQAKPLKAYIDDRILKLQTKGLVLTNSGGQFLAPNNHAYYTNYALDDCDPTDCGDPTECSRKHCL